MLMTYLILATPPPWESLYSVKTYSHVIWVVSRNYPQMYRDHFFRMHLWGHWWIKFLFTAWMLMMSAGTFQNCFKINSSLLKLIPKFLTLSSFGVSLVVIDDRGGGAVIFSSAYFLFLQKHAEVKRIYQFRFRFGWFGWLGGMFDQM